MNRLVLVLCLLALGGSAQRVSALDLRGSAGLERVVKQLLAMPECNPDLQMIYLGNGSGAAETAMINNQQQIAPMGRVLNSCTGAAEQLVIGMNPLVVATPSSANCSGLGANWAQTLRTLYAGADGLGSVAACSAPERVALADNFSSTLGGCGSSGITRIWHLFRPGELDATGSNDSLKIVLGAAGAFVIKFCNGDDLQDGDPIRRTCRDDEEVCGIDGTLGLVLPIAVPLSSPSFSSTSTDDNIWYRASAGVSTSVGKCQSGSFVYAPIAGLDQSCCHRARHGVTSSPCVVPSTGGKCLVPTTGTSTAIPHLMCNNARTKDCFAVNKPSTWKMGAIDGRAQNLIARGAAPYTTLKSALNKFINSAFYRYRWTGAGRSWSCTTSGLTTYGSACQELDSDRQLGCIVKQNHAAAGGNSDADVAFANERVLAVGGLSAQNLNDQALITGSNLNPSYPFMRKLYLSTLKGFSNVTGAESNLATCIASPDTINPVLTANGFWPALPDGVPSCTKCNGTACIVP